MSFLQEQLLQKNAIYRCNNWKCPNRATVRVTAEKLNSSSVTYSIVNDEGKAILPVFSCLDCGEHAPESRLYILPEEFCLRRGLKPRKIAVDGIDKIGRKRTFTSPVGGTPRLRDAGYGNTYVAGNDIPPPYSTSNPPPVCYRSTYGCVRTKTTENGDMEAKFHNGWDFYAKIGDPVYALADSRVIVADSVGQPVSGRRVQIQFTYENEIYRALYLHLDEVLADYGQCVAAGAIIGRAGITGNGDKDSPHLHLQVYRGKDTIDTIDPSYLFGDWKGYMAQPPLMNPSLLPPSNHIRSTVYDY